jgi:hypothetical protein
VAEALRIEVLDLPGGELNLAHRATLAA